MAWSSRWSSMHWDASQHQILFCTLFHGRVKERSFGHKTNFETNVFNKSWPDSAQDPNNDFQTLWKLTHCSLVAKWQHMAREIWVKIDASNGLATARGNSLTAPSHYLNQCMLISYSWENFTGNPQDICSWFEFQKLSIEITTAGAKYRVNRNYAVFRECWSEHFHMSRAHEYAYDWHCKPHIHILYYFAIYIYIIYTCTYTVE